MNPNYMIFAQRRARLLESANIKKNDVMLFFGGFERERYAFRQESSFFYLTGINEPAAVLALYGDGRQALYMPNFGKEREKWVNVCIGENSDPAEFGFDAVVTLSDPVKGYSYTPYFNEANYKHLLDDIRQIVSNNGSVFTLLDRHAQLFDQVVLVEKMQHSIQSEIKDVSPCLYSLRRVKGVEEISLLQKAIDITVNAQAAAAGVIGPEVFEHHVQAVLEHVFTREGASGLAFPSIVAAGKNSTVLHYTDRNKKINKGDLVVVDIGAEYGYYAADLTRTYPSSGFFTDRQREVYQLVLDTQEYIASLAKPGMYLRNSEAKENSLHYLAQQYLKKQGYLEYFPHGIGHFMGLDVHDVGDYEVPLQVGDVFTIEPGIYIAAESLGVRIEDDYLMQEEGARCLSSHLPKKVEDIEQMVQVSIDS